MPKCFEVNEMDEMDEMEVIVFQPRLLDFARAFTVGGSMSRSFVEPGGDLNCFWHDPGKLLPSKFWPECDDPGKLAPLELCSEGDDTAIQDNFSFRSKDEVIFDDAADSGSFAEASPMSSESDDRFALFFKKLIEDAIQPIIEPVASVLHSHGEDERKRRQTFLALEQKKLTRTGQKMQLKRRRASLLKPMRRTNSSKPALLRTWERLCPR